MVLAAAALRDNRWHDRHVLRVRFLDGDPYHQAMVRLAVRQWSDACDTRFSFTEDADAEVRVSFVKDGVSAANLGTDALRISRSKATVELNNSEGARHFHRTALHEFEHVLGFKHEHQSPRAAIPWNRDAVIAYFRDKGGCPRRESSTTSSRHSPVT